MQIHGDGTWHERVFEIVNRDPPPNAMPLSLQQVREADKALFRRLSDLTRGNLTQAADGTRPMEVHFEACMNHPEVQFCLILVVKTSHASASSSSVSKHPKGKEKGKKSHVKQDFSKSKASSDMQLPPGCSQHTPENKPICNLYNRGKVPICQGWKALPAGFSCVLQVFQAPSFPHL